MRKKLLILGGADIQVSAIEAGKRMGMEVITCDYLPDNPGHAISDAYFNVSTTDKQAVLDLAKSIGIDGISAYASDPGALTAAYVAEEMGLPGNSYDKVLQLSDKLRFRELMSSLDLACPRFIEVGDSEKSIEFIKRLPKGAILKPADTSGSKGVAHLYGPISREEFDRTVDVARQFSRSKRIILEEFIERRGNLISGDFLIDDGEIRFASFGDVHFNDRVNGLVPRSITLPSSKKERFQQAAVRSLSKIIKGVGISEGVFNADVIESSAGEPVIIDIGARNGGNFFNDIIYFHSGVNLIELSLKQCVGLPISGSVEATRNACFAHCVIHSEQNGVFQGVELSPELEQRLIHKVVYKNIGENVHRFINSSARIGIVLLKFANEQEMHEMVASIHTHIKVKLQHN